MRGYRGEQDQLFFTINVESRIRPDHPLRPFKKRVDTILEAMTEQFSAAYSQLGRPGVPPERLLKALLIMAVYSIRSERLLVERIDTDLLFRWFLDMTPEDAVFDATAFTHNRERLEEHGLTTTFFDAVLNEAITEQLCSDDHFSVDGTMIESMASAKSFQPTEEESNDCGPSDNSPAGHNTSSDGTTPSSDANSFKPRNLEVDFHGQKRSNKSHRSRTDPEARLHRKGPGKPALLSHMGHSLSENRNGLIVGISVTEASGTAESAAAINLIDRYRERHGGCPQTVGADKGYDNGPLLIGLEERGIEPHVAMKALEPADPETVRADRRANNAARHRMKERLDSVEYQISQRVRKKVEEGFGWLKTIAGLGRSRWVGRWKLRQQMELSAAAYNLIRMQKLRPI